jgi:hypothetical protein
MRLTWRDGVATGLVALGLAAYVEFVRVGHVFAIPDAKGVSAIVFLAGMAAGVVGGGLTHVGTDGVADRGVVVASVVGSVTLFAAAAAMLVGGVVLLSVVATGTLLLWGVATARRLVARPRVVDGRLVVYPDRFLARPRR